MIWSYTVPTEPGFYWWQASPEANPELIRLSGKQKRFAAFCLHDGLYLGEAGKRTGRWSPRIEAPKGDEPWQPCS